MSVMDRRLAFGCVATSRGGLYTPPRRIQQRPASFVAEKITQLNHGFRLTGIGGASRISVIVTRRLAATKGSSGNSGCVSARPATMKKLDVGTPSSSRILRTELARSADSSHGP